MSDEYQKPYIYKMIDKRGESRQHLNPVREMEERSNLECLLPVFSIEKDYLGLRLCTCHFSFRKWYAIGCNLENVVLVNT